jgi:hypothetical protein
MVGKPETGLEEINGDLREEDFWITSSDSPENVNT